MECVICLNHTNMVVEYECKHNVCHHCGTRLLMLYKNLNCPLCKQISKKSYIKSLNDFDLNEIIEKNVIYQNLKCKEDTKNLLIHKCKKCSNICKDTYMLRAHYREVHANLLCYECTDNKKQFWFEYILYDINTLRKHKLGKLNEDGFKGHVWCKFCKKYFYDEIAAKQHCNQVHIMCSVCDILGDKNRFYKNFSELEKHFKNFHYCCSQEYCLKIKAYAFPYKTELFEHLIKFHKQNIKLQDIKSITDNDTQFMDPTYLNVHNNIKSKIINLSKPIKSYISFDKEESKDSNFPDFLDRSQIMKIRREQLVRKSIISRLKINNHDQVYEIIEKIINKDISIHEGCDDLKLLIDGPNILKLFKDLYFEDIQTEINKYYKILENQILFPKFESKQNIKFSQPKKESKKIGFKILDLKKK